MSRKRHFLAVFHVKVDSALTTKLETIVPDWLLYYLALNLHNLISWHQWSNAEKFKSFQIIVSTFLPIWKTWWQARGKLTVEDPNDGDDDDDDDDI